MTQLLSIFLIIFLVQSISFGQQKDDIVYFKDFKKAINKQIENTGKHVVYIDTICHYNLTIPSWLKLKETGKTGAIGGTFKAENGEEMAFLIKSFSRYTFNTFDEFGKWVVTGMIPGQTVAWSQEHLCLETKELAKTSNGLLNYKVTIAHKGVAYISRYVLAETDNAFLWIEFTATGKNFDTYLNKSEEFLEGLEIKK